MVVYPSDSLTSCFLTHTVCVCICLLVYDRIAMIPEIMLMCCKNLLTHDTSTFERLLMPIITDTDA